MSTNNPSLVVQRLDRATDIASSVGQPIKCLVFPATGGVQAIDAAGAVLNLVGATGALAATVTDAVNNAASTALSLVHALSAGVGANGIGVTQRFVLPNSLGVAASAGQLTVSYTDATSGSEDSALGLTLQVGGAGTPVLAISAPTAGATTLTAAGSASASLNLVGAGGVVITPPAAASGVQTALTVNAANNGAVTAATEQVDVDFDLNRIVTWAAGAGPIALQRAFSITAPTYVGDNGAALTITRAATFYVSGAPSQGADITLSNPYAILVDSGTVRFDDQLSLGGNIALSGNAPTITATTADQGIALIPSGIGVVALQGSGAANIVAVDTTGGASRLGFYNIGPVARQVLATGGGATVDQVITALQNLGLLAQA